MAFIFAEYNWHFKKLLKLATLIGYQANSKSNDQTVIIIGKVISVAKIRRV